MAYEQSIHERVWALFKAYGAPGARMLHIPNGERRGPRTAAKLKRMGVVPGAEDFLCGALKRGPFFLELKRHGGRLSSDQKEFIADWEALGLPSFVAWSVEEAVQILQIHGVLRADINFSSCGPMADHGARGGSEVLTSGPSSKFTKEAETVA